MSHKIGESIANIQINVSELQKECAMFSMELIKVIKLARQIKTDASILIGEFGGDNESNDGRAGSKTAQAGMSDQPACGSCRYFYDLDGDWEGPLEGECRHRSPELLLDKGQRLVRLWPPVDNIDWCGEYEARDLQ